LHPFNGIDIYSWVPSINFVRINSSQGIDSL
jgi:hypothetical protein